MTKADVFTLAAYVLVCIGFGMIYRPLGVIAAGVVCLLLATAATRSKKNGDEN